MTEPFRLYLLSAPRCEGRDGRPLPGVGRSTKRLALLACLCARSGRASQARDSLIGLFWAESSQERARGALRQMVLQLRKELGDAIRNEGADRIAIDPSLLWCDVVAFRNAVRNKDFEEALALYQRDFLEGLYISGADELNRWVEEVRSSLRRTAAQVAWEFVESTEDAESRVTRARRAAVLSGTDEIAVRRLMTVLHQAGDNAGALREYELFASFTARELGALPGPETRELADRIRGTADAESLGMVADPPAAPEWAPSSAVEHEPSRRPLAESGGLTTGRKIAVAILGVIATGALAASILMTLGGRVSSTALDPARIAVANFDYVSDDPARSYLAAGLTHSLIHELAQVRPLSVVSRSGLPSVSGVQAEQLRSVGAGTLITGSVVASADRIRLVVQLRDLTGEFPLESLQVERPAGEILQLQDDLTRAVSQVLRTRLGRSIRSRELRAGAASAESWHLVREAEAIARPFWRAHGQIPEQRELEAAGVLARADTLLARAERLDPNWPEVHATKARVAFGRAKLVPPDAVDEYRRVLRSGRESAVQALETGMDTASVLTSIGTFDFKLGFSLRTEEEGPPLLRRADSLLTRAVELDPSHAEAWHLLSEMRREQGDLWAARRMAERALVEDAWMQDAADVHQQLFITSLDLQDFDAAHQWAARGAEMFPRDPRFGAGLLAIESWSGAGRIGAESALSLLRRMNGFDPPSRDGRAGEYQYIHRVAMYAGILARTGEAARAERLLDSLGSIASTREVWEVPFYWDDAQVSLLIGDTARALASIELWLGRYPNLRDYLAGHFVFEPLRRDPRFRRLIEVP